MHEKIIRSSACQRFGLLGMATLSKAVRLMEATPSRAAVRPMTADERKQIIGLYNEGIKVAEICRLAGRCRSSVYAAVNGSNAEHRNAAGAVTPAACEVCGEPVRYVPPKRREKEPGIGRFCSAKCMGKAKRLPSRSADELLCHRCRESKPPAEFYPHATSRRGYQYWCISCCSAVRRERVGIPQDPKLTRKYKLKEAYGITPEDYDAMYKQQQGRCAICGVQKEPWEAGSGIEGRDRFLVVDHCHVDGWVRGLLCGNCNHGLGKFCDDPALMRAAADYLIRTMTRAAVRPLPASA